jgi:hypothetical protein
MRDTNQPIPDTGHRLQNPPEVFPDLATCHVKPAGFADCFVCLSYWASQCPHILYMGGEHYCRHPSAPEILSRSEGRKDKPA